MDVIVKPIPRVFKAQVSNAFASKVTIIFTIALFASLDLGRVLYGLLSHSFFALALPSAITLTVLLIWRVRVGGKTKARIEVCGNDICYFDDLGDRAIKGNMREIVAVYRSSQTASKAGNGGSSIDFFHILFRNGALMTFGENFDNHYVLLKILHARTGVDPIRMPWSDFTMLGLETSEHRALKASELKALA